MTVAVFLRKSGRRKYQSRKPSCYGSGPGVWTRGVVEIGRTCYGNESIRVRVGESSFEVPALRFLQIDDLFVGTQKDNIEDCREKGRLCVGSRVNLAKLDEAAVAAIREGLREGELQGVLAARFDISPQTISDISRRRTWKHVL